VLLSRRLSRRSKNVIHPVIDWAAPRGLLPLPGLLQVATPFPWFPRSFRRAPVVRSAVAVGPCLLGHWRVEWDAETRQNAGGV